MESKNYHADKTRLSYSSIKRFIELGNPQRWWYEFNQPIEPTKEMILGTMVHTAILEPEKFESQYIECKKVDWRTTETKELAAKNPGKELITTEQMRTCFQMIEGFLKNQTAVDLVAGCKKEESFNFKLAPYKSEFKCRMDGINPKQLIIIDVKTTDLSSEKEYAWTIKNYLYHLQAYMYIRAAQECVAKDFWKFIHIVVEKKPPYTVTCWEMPENALEKGAELFTKAMNELDGYFITGQYPPVHTGIKTINVPFWEGK